MTRDGYADASLPHYVAAVTLERKQTVTCVLKALDLFRNRLFALTRLFPRPMRVPPKTVMASLRLLNVLRVFRILRMRRLKRTVSYCLFCRAGRTHLLKQIFPAVSVRGLVWANEGALELYVLGDLTHLVGLTSQKNLSDYASTAFILCVGSLRTIEEPDGKPPNDATRGCIFSCVCVGQIHAGKCFAS